MGWYRNTHAPIIMCERECVGHVKYVGSKMRIHIPTSFTHSFTHSLTHSLSSHACVANDTKSKNEIKTKEEEEEEEAVAAEAEAKDEEEEKMRRKYEKAMIAYMGTE